MAEDSSVQVLCEETTCSICLEYFKDPVTIECGHNFCQACLSEYCRKSGPEASCPQCRETVQPKNFKLNRQLASIVAIAKQFSLRGVKRAETLGPVCEQHLEPLKLFCQNDQALICVVCDKAKEHRGHEVIPKEEAFQEYKVIVQAYLEFLKKEREAVWSSQQSGKAEGQTLLEQTEREKQKIMAEFKQLHKFLDAQERHLLAKLKDLDDQVKDKRNAHIDKLSEEISAVDHLIKEVEEKQKQPASEFLQDLRSILKGCSNKEKFVDPVAFPSELKKQIENFSKIHPFLDTTINEFKETVLAGPMAKKGISPESGTGTVPTLVLSAACSSNQYSFGSRSENYLFGSIFPNPYQYSCCAYVMGFERISSGKCSWVMNIKNENFWAVGVALEGFRGRDMSSLTPAQGIWAVGKLSGAWYAFTSPGTHNLSCPWSRTWMPACHISPCNATTIQVALNYEQGSVAFFNADNNSPIYTFHSASFSGQPVSSWFCVGK